uniref:Ketoreductase CTB6 ) n=1 Tax=Ganoderma boninense TaxID=34458 RepID=A0A5K1JR31_9APHY|nr:Ketoreductase CTB6 (EC (Cercosporin toxin biosynthesis cluster protein 6) [Ganoderma boninense]
MPTLASGKVLVTGANGYIAAWVVKDLLENGYAVRGTVRSESKATYLREYFKAFGDKFEIAIVPDITKVRSICPLLFHIYVLIRPSGDDAQDGAFDQHVADVDAIAHIASPVHLSDGEPSEVIDPAVRGTRTVLSSALLHRARVRRVFVTSSAAALKGGNDVDLAGRTSNRIDESSWNNYSVQRCEEKGRAADPMHKYSASKVLAERGAWEFYESAKKDLAAKGETLEWDMAVFCPPFVFGPSVQESPSPEALSGSQAEFYKRVVQGVTGGELEQLTQFGLWVVDVRDLARAFVLGLQKEEAGGERFVICGFPAAWQDLSE